MNDPNRLLCASCFGLLTEPESLTITIVPISYACPVCGVEAGTSHGFRVVRKDYAEEAHRLLCAKIENERKEQR